MVTNITRRLGAVVLYRLSEQDVQQIIQRRRSAGLITYAGNDPHEGDVFPAMIVRDWADPAIISATPSTMNITEYVDGQPVNLQVFLDGNDVFWSTSRKRGLGKGHWEFLSVVVQDDEQSRREVTE
jgi:hypothetical protein